MVRASADGRRCTACGRSVDAFRPGPGNRPSARCPRCHALERRRFLGLVLDDVLASLPRFRRILDVDSLALVRRRSLSVRAPSYVGAAPLPEEQGDLVADLCRLPFADDAFDVLVCTDALLRVPDDAAALRELHRVTAPGGVMLLQVLRARDEPTEEDVVAPIMDRVRRFGRAERLRHYGGDFPERLAQAGWWAARLASEHYLDDDGQDRFGVPAGQEVWAATATPPPALPEPTHDRAHLEAALHPMSRLQPSPDWSDHVVGAQRMAADAVQRVAGRGRRLTSRLRSPLASAGPSSRSGPFHTHGRRDLVRPPLWIIGAPRSGTTYLVEILSRHPGVLITNETRVFTFLNRTLNSFAHQPWVLMNHRREFIAHLRASVPSLVEGFYVSLQARPSMRWGDKFPHYADPKANPGCLDLIEESFPDGQYINVIRDGREVVSSIVGKDFAPLEEAVDVWRRHVLHAREFLADLPPERHFEVRYEDLVADAEGIVKRLCGFLDVPADPTVMDFVRRQACQRTPFSYTLRSDGTIGHSLWQQRLGDDAPWVEEQLEDLLHELGYAPSALAAARDR